MYDAFGNYNNLENISLVAKFLTSYLKEDEIYNMLTAIEGRIIEEEDSGLFKDFIQIIVENKKFSEEFIMHFISYLTKKNILIMHSFEIKTGEYSQVALYFQVK